MRELVLSWYAALSGFCALAEMAAPLVGTLLLLAGLHDTLVYWLL